MGMLLGGTVQKSAQTCHSHKHVTQHGIAACHVSGHELTSYLVIILTMAAFWEGEARQMTTASQWDPRRARPRSRSVPSTCSRVFPSMTSSPVQSNVSGSAGSGRMWAQHMHHRLEGVASSPYMSQTNLQ